MTQYQIQNAAHKINGYQISKPLESFEASFDRAKVDTINQLKKDLADVENLTFDQYKYILKTILH